MEMELTDGRLEELARCVPGNAIIYAIQGTTLKTLWYSPDIPGISGYTPEEYDRIISEDASRIILKNDLPILYRNMSEIQAGGGVVSASLRIRHRTRGIIWIRFKARIIGTRAGHPVALTLYTDVSMDIDGYINVLESTSNIVYIIDRKTWELYYINKAAFRLWNNHDYVGRTCFQFAYGFDGPCPWCITREMSDSAECGRDLFDPRLKKHLRLHCRNISWYGRDAILVIAADISPEKKAEEEYNTFLKDLLSVNTPNRIGSFHINLSRNLCDSGVCPTGYIGSFQDDGTYDGLLERSGRIISTDEERRYYHEQFSRRSLLELFKQGQTRISHVFRDIYEDGNIHPTETIVNMVKNPRTGDIEGVIYSFDVSNDVRDQHITRRLTRDEFDLIAIINKKTGALDFRSMREGLPLLLPGETYSAYVERNVRKTVVPESIGECLENISLKAITSHLARRDTYSFAFSVEVGDTIRRKQIRCSYLDDAREDILFILLDVTDAYRQEQKQLNETRDALRRAKLASRAKTEFISRISHDIRTPISAITSMMDFAREDIDDREKLLADLGKIETSSTFLLSLINDVLDISRVDSGRMELHPGPYPFSEYWGNLRNMFEPLCREKGVFFRMDCPAMPVPGIIVDKVRFNQITLNILSNAVKYTPGGGSITYSSESRILPGGRVECRYTVSDTGIGMDEAFQKKMFDPFTQERDNPLRGGCNAGSGLGLAIVKRIVDLMQGEITVQSRLGEGTSVSVRLVLPQMGQMPSRAGGSDRMPQAEDALRHRRVLLVEDNPINTEIALRMLKSFGMDVTHAENGLKALELFEEAAPGTYLAVLMDIQMPVMDGYQATERLRALDRPDAGSIPVFALTADVFSDAVERSREAGMDGFITKPIDRRLLRERLLGIL